MLAIYLMLFLLASTQARTGQDSADTPSAETPDQSPESPDSSPEAGARSARGVERSLRQAASA
ncbi:hypothetical protein V3C99_015976 [Haemonchus contortus]|uniref:Secreted protein n=1 Tax=Haemonchus contortus TaxID=6289 RepID=A0A7I4YWH2_HAECO